MDPLAEYETVPDALPVDAGDIADTDVSPADPAADAPADTPVDDTPSWTGPSQEDWEQTQYALSRLVSTIDQPQPVADVQQGPGDPPELDPFDPESVKAYQDWREEQLLGRISELVSPLSERAQAEARAEQTNLLRDAAHDVEQRKGEFIGDEKAISFARDQMLAAAFTLFPDFAQRYGMTDRASDLALEAAHQQVKSYQDSIVSAGVERYKNELSTLSGAPNDPASGATGLHATPQVQGDEMDFARHYAARA